MRKKTENNKPEKGITIKVKCTHCGTSFKTWLDTKACVKCYMAYLGRSIDLKTPAKKK